MMLRSIAVLVLILCAVICLDWRRHKDKQAKPARRRKYLLHLPRNRVRHLRLRLHLRLRPGRGFATLGELWWRWGRLAAFRKSKRARPSLSARQRARQPSQHSVALGRAQRCHQLRIPTEEHVLVEGPPRSGKSGLLGSVILHYPGAVVSTSTKPDMFTLTSGIRSRLGPVAVFNPQSVGGLTSSLQWSPLEGCEDPAVAIRRADAFTTAVSQKGVEDATFWASKASDFMRAFFLAGAISKADMRLVARWVLTGNSADAEHILTSVGASQWAGQLAELRGPAEKTSATVRMVMSRALAFMADPALATAVIPGANSFDIREFLRAKGSLYLIAESQGEETPLAPLFACLASEIHFQAAMLGQSMPGGRLDPSLLLALDEVTSICPIPVPTLLADSGGKGIQIITVAHGDAQLASRWGQHGMRAIRDTSGVQVYLPGITDPATLASASALCGQMAHRERGSEHLGRHDVASVDMIRELPPGFALVIRGGHAPVISKLPRAWRERQYRRAKRRGTAVATLAPARARPEPVPEPVVQSNGHSANSHGELVTAERWWNGHEDGHD